MAKVKAGVGLANVVVDELNVLTTRTQRMVFKKWRNGGCDCDGGKRLRREAGQQRDGGQCWRRRDATTAKAGRPRRRRDDHGEGGTTTAKRGGTRRRRRRRRGHDCEERGTAKRWRTVSAKAGHDAEERRDGDEERRDDVEKRRDSDEKRRDSEDDVDDAKGLGTQRWSWLVEESKSCAATKSGA